MGKSLKIKTRCCKYGKKYLTHISVDDCIEQGIDKPATGFYIDVREECGKTTPTWSMIHFCPFCQSSLTRIDYLKEYDLETE